MDFYNGLSRQLLNNSSTAKKAYKKNLEDIETVQDSKLFFDLATKTVITKMAYLEHNRANHVMLKNVFESFQ